ncbi:MAG: arginine decarboxylase [Desulfobulbaceae bacterium]|nr:MAG: arginine decarboxylase [Desulfobulbaceae bacterium]
MHRKHLRPWSHKDSAELYGIHDWSAGYFSVSEKGEVHVHPRPGQNKTGVSLYEIIEGVRERGLGMPLLLRFTDILASQIGRLHKSFRQAIKDNNYKSHYQGVYPVKVNQQQQVIEEITRQGRTYRHGLEVGSKAELIIALAYIDDPESFIICNGYKDEEFMELACYGRKMGLNVIIVVEMLSELELIFKSAERLGVSPSLGVRVKLSSRAGGLWQDSGGDRSFFGLTASEIIEMVDTLKHHDKLHCLRMLHYHIGSQVPNIRSIRTAISEAMRFYVNLVGEGAAMGILDVGGGLAVDYDGSHTNFESSRNYSLLEYCSDIVEVVGSVADDAGVEHPVLVSESGRATVAHHEVLLFNILDVCQLATIREVNEFPIDSHQMLQNLHDLQQTLSAKNLQEWFHDATYYLEEIRTLFRHGVIPLRQRALAEEIFWDIMEKISVAMKGMKFVPDELKNINSVLADTYYGNFSVFQSLPDSWAIGQLFPIMPVHRLNEEPTRNAVLSDVTCDSDGKIDKFTDLHDIKKTLLLHVPNSEEYYLGVFLVGAYQETLGDLHNLLGDTNVVAVSINENDEVVFSREIQGDTVADVLSYVEYEPRLLTSGVRAKAEKAVQAGLISAVERREIMEAFEAGLRGYTYFEQ